jgi:hypothetical protein
MSTWSISVNTRIIMIHRLFAMTDNLKNKNGKWPRFLYIYLINPQRLKFKARTLKHNVKVRFIFAYRRIGECFLTVNFTR